MSRSFYFLVGKLDKFFRLPPLLSKHAQLLTQFFAVSLLRASNVVRIVKLHTWYNVVLSLQDRGKPTRSEVTVLQSFREDDEDQEFNIFNAQKTIPGLVEILY